MSYYVYFIQKKDCTGPIKIGVSGNVKRRLSALQTASPDKLYVIGIERFDTEKEAYDVEAFLHKSFNNIRMNGEWFQASTYLLEAVARWTEPYKFRGPKIEFPIGWGKGGQNIPEPQEIYDWAKAFYKSRCVPFKKNIEYYRKSDA